MQDIVWKAVVARKRVGAGGYLVLKGSGKGKILRFAQDDRGRENGMTGEERTG